MNNPSDPTAALPGPEPFPPFETLLTRIEAGSILVVTMNRPEVGNARNTRMATELLEVWTRLAQAPGGIRCAVLTGAGDRLFSGGGDLKERKGMTDAAWQAQHHIFEQGRDQLLAAQVPVIAAVNGHAYGGGCETALLCDFIYAVRGARFALPEVTRGILPGSGGTQMLPRAVGERRAKEIILSGRPFSTEEAHAWGMVNRLCEREELMPAVLESAAAMAANAPLAVREAKRSIQNGMEVALHDGLAFEVEAYNRLVVSEDRREGVLAFNEKRAPRWQGR
ncbi:enoyl-CoA hydratase/isomerase family protein [Humitalea sp. 24SJ18S-53]|uniref:enoyl-CoA hydratase/isomerase family protein n=1 Tax=Humitalea sp. 24SJ18S-53 TaxID=3422307 RepID=UPI003D675F5B